MLEDAVWNAQYLDIRQIAEQTEREVPEVEMVSVLQGNDVIIDIRSPEEHEEEPLQLDNHTILHIPFYKLSTQFPSLDQNKQYLLYCERGVMSRLQALYLKDQGFNNISVFRKKHQSS